MIVRKLFHSHASSRRLLYQY